MQLRCVVAAFALALLAGCQAKPSYDYRTGEVLLETDFSQPYAWEAYTSPNGDTEIGVADGVYRMKIASDSFIWGLNAQRHTDVMIEAQSAQRSETNDNAFGLMCRAEPGNTGDGYYFLISGDGYWSIRKRVGETMHSLVEFTRSDAIYRGRSINAIRVLCVDDYLALYVNDRFVGETRDSTFASGFAGLVVAASNKGEAEVTFDNLRVVEARLVPPA